MTNEVYRLVSRRFAAGIRGEDRWTGCQAVAPWRKKIESQEFSGELYILFSW